MLRFAIFTIFWLWAGLAPAQVAAPPASSEASPEIVILPYEYINENAQYVNSSGDQSIWNTYPPNQRATLQVQVAASGEALPASTPGEIAERRGVAGIRIHVEGPAHFHLEPARNYEDWRTDQDGIFVLRVPLPPTVGQYTFFFRTDDPDVRSLSLTIQVKSPNWILWLAFGLIGGLGLLLTGMNISSEGLQAAAGAKFRETLHTLTKNPARGLVAGMAATFFMQSSTATSVMMVGFVRAGMLTLRQSLGPIFGAAIGTTITVQLIAFNLQTYALPMMGFGFALSLFGGRSPRVGMLGKIVFGFGMIFFGLAVMGDVIIPLKASPGFQEALAHLTSRPVWCVLLTGAFTAMIASSGATLGIAIALANQNLLTLEQALPIIYGANIGTTLTAIWASVGGTTEGKRVAWAHLLFKVGMVVFFSLPFMPDLLVWMATHASHGMASVLPDVAILADTPARRMANADTIMCVISAALAILFGRGALERTVVWMIPQNEDEKKEERPKFLDMAMLESPTLALGATVREISRMARFVEEMVRASHRAIETRDVELLNWLSRRDDKVDAAFGHINEYLTKLTAKQPNPEDTARAIGYLYVINDLESIGDLVVKMLIPLVNKVIDQDLHFSDDGLRDLRELHATVCDSLTKAILALTTPGEKDLFEEVIKRHEELQAVGRRLHLRHLKRLQEGLTESIETSSVHLDIVNFLLRMHYHIYSIAWTASRGVAQHLDSP